jgi:hypothetical protein
MYLDPLPVVHPATKDHLRQYGWVNEEVQMLPCGVVGAGLADGGSCAEACVVNFLEYLTTGTFSKDPDRAPILSHADFENGVTFEEATDRMVGLATEGFEMRQLLASCAAGPVVRKVIRAAPAPRQEVASVRLSASGEAQEDAVPSAPPVPVAPRVPSLRKAKREVKLAQRKESDRQTKAEYKRTDPDNPPPPAQSNKDRAKKNRFRRPRTDMIISAAGVQIPEGFASGSHCLRRTPMDMETAKAFTSDPKLRQLLALEMMVLPKDCPEGIKDSTRRSHLYTLKDLLEVIVRKGKGQDRLDQAFIGALNALAEERKWTAPTLGSKAADLYGCLQRLDQYTNLKPLELLKEGSFWKDASKEWLKKICGHTPSVGEVTPEAVATLLRDRKWTHPTRALLALCWCTTGRPYNWLYVKKTDVKIVKETEQMMKEDAERRGTAVKEPGYKIMVTWRDHKTLGTRQCFTTPSWINATDGQMVKDHFDQIRGEWLFPKSMWTTLKQNLGDALRGHDRDWDLKALRRGSLSTMARNEVPLDDLRLFSGHKSEGTLLRYLGFGIHARINAVKGEAAARGLLPTTGQNELDQVVAEAAESALRAE